MKKTSNLLPCLHCPKGGESCMTCVELNVLPVLIQLCAPVGRIGVDRTVFFQE
jgi:hypothetical protein